MRLPEKRAGGAIPFFYLYYDVCKSTKGVRLNGDSMLAVSAGSLSMPRNRNKERASEMPRPSQLRQQIRVSDQRHQLKRQTSDEVTVWMNFSECTKSPAIGTPAKRTWLSFLLRELNRYSVFQYRPGSQSNLYS